jgi:glycosyltransferase involved in cell wall biosynthesis
MSTPADRPLRILHCHSTFGAGGKELRSVALMNAFGATLENVVVSGDLEAMGARDHIADDIKASFPADFPDFGGLPSPGRLVNIAQALKPFDLILTYNWGAMNVVMAHTVFARNFGLPPLIHHEDGFNEDEAGRLIPRRNWFRRAALTGTHSLIVPSMVLEQIALNVWQQPRSRVKRIGNGIDTVAFAAQPDHAALRVIKRRGERWIGTLAGLRAVKQLPMLVRAIRDLPEEWQLVIIGDGPERDAIRAEANRLDISHRVHLPGAVNDPASVIGLFDIFALSSRSEQFPLSVAEAMAAGLPVVAPDVGDIRNMLAEPNAPFIAIPDDTEALGAMLAELAHDADLRVRIGAANKAKATAEFDVSTMVDRYRAAYGKATGRIF